jgi:hypothetical protein
LRTFKYKTGWLLGPRSCCSHLIITAACTCDRNALFDLAIVSAGVENIGMSTLAEQTNSAEVELIPLKRAAYTLQLTPEGLRQRLIRLGNGIRRGGRWYVAVQSVSAMQQAAQVLGGRR